MRFPLSLTLKITQTILKNRLHGKRKFATVLQLEPLHACNLACTGCGRIREYASTLKETLPLADCLAAAQECDAPMVSICGGEPLLYQQIEALVAGLRAQGRIVYLCTNGLLMRRKLCDYLAVRWNQSPRRMDPVVSRILAEGLISPQNASDIRTPQNLPLRAVIEPSTWFYWNVHLDGMEAEHDRSVDRRGVFKECTLAIRLAKRLGFQVATNTTVYNQTDMAGLQEMFDLLGDLGVDGHTLSPGYNFATVGQEKRLKPPANEYFLTRAATVEKFQHVEDWARRYPLLGTPIYFEFLAGKRELACSAWAIPTRNVQGWRGPCYLIADTHYSSYAELLETTDWSRFGTVNGQARDPRCEHCMVHCGHEPTASLGIGARRGDTLKNIRFNFGPRPRIKNHAPSVKS